MKLQKYTSSETTEDFETFYNRKFAVKVGNQFIAEGNHYLTTNTEKVSLFESYVEALEWAISMGKIEGEKADVYSTI